MLVPGAPAETGKSTFFGRSAQPADAMRRAAANSAAKTRRMGEPPGHTTPSAATLIPHLLVGRPQGDYVAQIFLIRHRPEQTGPAADEQLLAEGCICATE